MKFFNPMNFDPSNCSMNIHKSLKSPTPKMGAHLEMCGFIPSHSHTFWNVNVTPKLHSWPSLFHAPCLRCEPKVKVMTFLVVHNHIHLSIFMFSTKIKNSQKYMVPKCNANIKFKLNLRWFKYMNIKILDNYMVNFL
jgi:hypothetical protein